MIPDVTSGIPPLKVMNSEEIRAILYAIADQSSTDSLAPLVRELGDLMFARLQHTTSVQQSTQKLIEGLALEFKALGTQLRANDRAQADKIHQMIDRVHTLSNRFMAVEDKTNQAIELLDVRLAEILDVVSGNNDGSTINNTTD